VIASNFNSVETSACVGLQQFGRRLDRHDFAERADLQGHVNTRDI
jgi:hypothetical protein